MLTVIHISWKWYSFVFNGLTCVYSCNRLILPWMKYYDFKRKDLLMRTFQPFLKLNKEPMKMVFRWIFQQTVVLCNNAIYLIARITLFRKQKEKRKKKKKKLQRILLNSKLLNSLVIVVHPWQPSKTLELLMVRSFCFDYIFNVISGELLLAGQDFT